MKLTFALLLAFSSAFAAAQSINLDFDIEGGGPEAGQGVPSSSFGAAGNQPGFWNLYGVTQSSTSSLRGLGGQATSVTMRKLGIGGGIGGGSGWTINSGDYRLLLNDYMTIPDEVTYRFEGLTPGRYRVVTYAVNATGETVSTFVDIQGQVRVSTGPMPGNALIEGVTHTVHDFTLSGSILDIRAYGTWPYSELNGFQIIAVPEPATVALLTSGFIAMRCRRRRGPRNSLQR